MSLEPLYQVCHVVCSHGLNSGSARALGGGESGQYQVFPTQGPPAVDSLVLFSFHPPPKENRTPSPYDMLLLVGPKSPSSWAKKVKTRTTHDHFKEALK